MFVALCKKTWFYKVLQTSGIFLFL